MRKVFITIMALALSVGCASTHPGWNARALENEKARNLRVSVYNDSSLSDAANAFYDFTIENKELNWLRVESAEVTFSDSDKTISNVIVGKDLVSWADSQSQKAKISEHNTNMAVTAAILGGTALMLASGKSNSGLATTGAVVAGAGVVADVTRGIQKDIKLAEQSAAVPETHILGGPFSVPGQGVLKKWILVGFPQKERPTNGNLVLKTVEGDKLIYAFELKDPTNRNR